ncbi:MAG TPA: uroporphyrinogen-III synthase [Paucimonas sp.]|nr:uroporphyrinogen-III synthase [Paucimonas sp.]
MADSVVITRPLGQADALAQKVAAIGRDAIIFPLLEIQPLADTAALQATLADLADCALVVFVSPNAIDAAFAQWPGRPPRWPEHIIFAVMGEGSRAALARHGVTPANAHIVSPHHPERTDSQTLLEALDLEALKGKQALIIRGETGRELLADELRAAGVIVRQVAAYRRVAPTLDKARRAQLLTLLASRNDWIVTSSEALRILLRMIEQIAGPDGVAKMQQQHIVVPHARIEETAKILGFQRITLTASGDDSLLAALQFRA